MTLDSTVGGDDANSYNTLAELEAYAVERGIDISSSDDATKEGWLIRGTEYIDSQWHGQWKGSITSETQALAWPRQNVTDAEGRDVADDEIPKDVKKATNEMALYAKSSANLYSYVQDGVISEKSAGVGKGAVESSVKYLGGSKSSFGYTNVGKLLSGLLYGGYGTGVVVRT